MRDIQQQLIDLARKQAHIQQKWSKTGQQRLLKFVVTFIPKILDVESCSIFIQDVGREKIWLACSTDLSEREIEVPRLGSLVGEVISSGTYQIRTGMDKQPGVHKDVDADTGFQTRNILCVPIMGLTAGHVVGAIQVLNKRDDCEYTEADRLVLEDAAYYMQLFVENIFLGQEINSLSEKVRKRVAFADIMLRIWAVLMAILIVAIVVHMTPVLISGF